MKYFDKEIFNLFIGGICSILLPVFIIIGKQGYKRQQKREELQKENNVGDIDSWLNDSYEYKQSNFRKLMTQWCLQPLFIICISILFSSSGLYIGLLTFVLVLLIFLHELWVANRYSENAIYQLFMLLVWIISYLIIVNNK
ncbi:hypothetical protein [Chryseobacterium sp.]|uniref:hypothetical protein n=1 Tax=Chryseobacterium sp. TaxID=1871047 RepID=UPI0025C70496|nr:hypothetical protein [Chryseobacterium sp.]MBV8328004.1 hypothetical protein [Chryseobacterium sp.]